MQNPLSVLPKDQGEPRVPSRTAQSRRGLQSKSQFRTIAPKIVPKVLTSGVLPCLSPSLSEHVNPGSPKALVMPSQNYALMQLAGHEGTFSLIALPHVTSTHPIQKPRIPLPKNLKVPIPRYQPPRKNKAKRERPTLSPSEGGCSKPPAQTRECPQPSLSPPACSELPHKGISSEHPLSPDQAPASSGTAALPDGGSRRDLGPPLRDSPADPDTPAAPSLSTPEEPPAEQGYSSVAGTADLTSKKATNKPPVVAGENPKAQMDLAKATTTSFSPAIGDGAAHLICSVPKDQPPILPYSRVKAAEFCKIEPGAHTEDLSLPGPGAGCETMPLLTEGLGAATKVAPKPGACESAFCPTAKPSHNHRTKPSGGAAKRRGRKCKFPEEMLAFQGRRRKYIVSKCRDGKDRVKNDPQEPRDPKPGATKKYRSIMPKPAIVVPAVAPPASPAAPQPQAPGSLGQGVLFNNSLTCKFLSCKQSISPSIKPSVGFRNGFSGIKKPWHRCHVCDHHFQFKQHLRDHMNTHTNRQPYSCWVCRKAYVRPGSLNAHMKLQHSENRPKRLMCCEFCAKVFGHVRVYFGHLKEVHGVVISTEASPSEPQPGDTQLEGSRDSKTRDLRAQRTEGATARENKSSLEEEDLFLNQANEVRLQITCGRCQITALSFAEIKFHLLYAHGEEIQGRLQDGILSGSKRAQEELIRHAAAYWKEHPERRKLGQQRPSEEEACALPKSQRPLHPPQRNSVETLTGNDEGAPLGSMEPGGDPQDSRGAPPTVLGSPSGFSCLLCTQTLRRKEELLLHWEQRHNCEEPSRLWALLNASSSRGVGQANGTEP